MSELMIELHSLLEIQSTGYVEWVRQAMHKNFEWAREHLGRAAEWQKWNYDERAQDRNYETGEWMLLFYPPNHRNKLSLLYIGPYKIIGKPGLLTYTLL